MKSFIDLENSHWMLGGFCDSNRYGSGFKYRYLRSCNGADLWLYDSFGNTIKVRVNNYIIKSIHARGMLFGHSIDKNGQLCIVGPDGNQLPICAWEKPSKDKLVDIKLPNDRLFELMLPPVKHEEPPAHKDS